MALKSPQAMAQVTMIVSIVVYFFMFISVGVSSMVVDSSLRADQCGKTTHLWKFTMLNAVIASGELVTYMTFPGGGEGARARALMLSIAHLSLCVWGFLMQKSLPQCISLIGNQYSKIHFFYEICLWHNLILTMGYISHEVFLGEYMGADLTLVPEVRKVPSSDTVDFNYGNADVSPQGALHPPTTIGATSPAPSATITPTMTPSVDVPPLNSKSPGGTDFSTAHAVLKPERPNLKQEGNKYQRPAL